MPGHTIQREEREKLDCILRPEEIGFLSPPAAGPEEHTHVHKFMLT